MCAYRQYRGHVLLLCVLLGILQSACSEISYGHILDRFVPIENDDPDIIQVAKFALSYLHGRQPGPPSPAAVPRLRMASKHILQHTHDSETPTVFTFQDIYGRLHRRPVILGITYYVDLEWDLPSQPHDVLGLLGAGREGVRLIHRFAITKDRTAALSVLKHTVLAVAHDSEVDDPEYLRAASHLQYGDQGWTFLNNNASTLRVDASLQHEHGPLARIAAMRPSYLPHDDPGVHTCPAQLHEELPDYLRAPPGWPVFAGARREPNVLRMLSLNIWNINGHDQGVYDSRAALLGAMLLSADADVIALQEVRHDAKRDSQPLTLARHVPGYQYVFQPAMSYPEQVFNRVEEGVAVFSRYPILSHAYILLSRDENDDGDTHQRVCLRVTVATPAGPMQIFVTHLSLSEEARDRSVVEIWRFMQRTPELPQILVGDLNALPSTRAMRFLAGEEVLAGVRTDMLDAWLQLYPEPRGGPDYVDDEEPRDAGLTFSTLDANLSKRIDYAFVRNMRCSAIQTYPAQSARVVGEEDFHASDHLGLLMQLELRPAAERQHK